MFLKLIFQYFILLLPVLVIGQSFQEFPVLYQGRFVPVDAYAQLWLNTFYHAQTIHKEDQQLFQASTALEFMLKLDINGYETFQEMPLFWIQSKKIKELANLAYKRQHFSYKELNTVFFQNSHTSQKIFTFLAQYATLKKFHETLNKKENLSHFEAKQLGTNVWLSYENSQLNLLSLPQDSAWKNIKEGFLISFDIQNITPLFSSYQQTSETFFDLFKTLKQFAQIETIKTSDEIKFQKAYEKLKDQNLTHKDKAQLLEQHYPIQQRLKKISSLFLALPSANQDHWFPLKALTLQIYSTQKGGLIPIPNFTAYSNTHFETIRDNYMQLIAAMQTKDLLLQKSSLNALSESLINAYENLGGVTYQEANGKMLNYPTIQQLALESYYSSYPWVKILIIMYILCFIFSIFAYRLKIIILKKLSWGLLLICFILHGSLLLVRTYLLNRPPVSNMFETVLYVPWIVVGATLILDHFKKNFFSLIAAPLISLILLSLSEFAGLNQNLVNVQAVLDSQFWLFVHVLLIVGSYGLFILGGVLAHFYLVLISFYKKETEITRTLSTSILQSIYIGLAMLITGTLLGGVWAAESWGRFWDWDPKESWAFISISVYLLGVHAYRYHKIHTFGLAIGAIIGLLAISFTWYGVNYILGTGLHSYGFGNGGEKIYYLYVLGEALFLLGTLMVNQQKKPVTKIF